MEFNYIDVDVYEALENNPSALKSSPKHKNRDKFFKEVVKHKSILNAIERNMSCNSNNSLINRFYNHIVHLKRGIKK